jgi:hypothetical protein
MGPRLATDADAHVGRRIAERWQATEVKRILERVSS